MTDEMIKNIIKQRLSDQRYIHSLAVADEARVLAQRYGADCDKAYTAGLLHDICKCDSPDKQLEIINQAGERITPLELAAPKLYHAIAGAALIRTQFNIDDADLIAAVRYHTTARAGMSILERVIYLADYTSADRSYNGVEQMRSAVLNTMDEAMLIALKFSICDLVEQSRAVHPDTLMAYNELTFIKK